MLAPAAERSDQRAWLVFDKSCIKAVHKTPETKLRFPMVNGEPDKKKGQLEGVGVDYDPNCGYYEIEKLKAVP